jgi:hypothetical protein
MKRLKSAFLLSLFLAFQPVTAMDGSQSFDRGRAWSIGRFFAPIGHVFTQNYGKIMMFCSIIAGCFFYKRWQNQKRQELKDAAEERRKHQEEEKRKQITSHTEGFNQAMQAMSTAGIWRLEEEKKRAERYNQALIVHGCNSKQGNIDQRFNDRLNALVVDFHIKTVVKKDATINDLESLERQLGEFKKMVKTDGTFQSLENALKDAIEVVVNEQVKQLNNGSRVSEYRALKVLDLVKMLKKYDKQKARGLADSIQMLDKDEEPGFFDGLFDLAKEGVGTISFLKAPKVKEDPKDSKALAILKSQ